MKPPWFKLRNPIGLIILITILGKIIIYLSELLIAIRFGACAVTDAFVLARAIPFRINGILTWALYSAFIPFYIRAQRKDNQEAAFLFKIFSRDILIFSFLASLVITLYAGGIIKVIAPGFDYNTALLSQRLLEIMCWVVFLGCIAMTFQSINSSRRNELVAAMSNPVNNLVILVSILLFTRFWGIYSVAFAIVLGSVFRMLVQFVSFNPIKELITKKIPAINIRQRIQGIWKLFFAIIAILLVNESIVVVMRIFASHYEGSVSVLNYGYVIAQAPFLITETIIFYFFYPLFIEHSLLEDKEKFRTTIVKFLRLIFFILLPFSVFMFISSGLISRVLFLHGKFDWQASDKVASAIALFSLGLLGFAIDSVAFRVAIIKARFKQYAMNLAFRFLLNFVLNLVFLRFLPIVPALSLAFSLTLIFYSILLMKFVGEVIQYRFMNRIFLYFILKVIFSALVLGNIVFITIHLCTALNIFSGFLSRLIVLFLVSVVGGAVYLLLVFRFRVAEIDLLKDFCFGKPLLEME